jgi:cell division protein FtsB
MRWLGFLLLALIAALQYPMWLGKGGWLQVREYDRQLMQQRETNAKLKARNEALDADVRDLKTGYEAIEERARADLGMIKQDEVFFQLQPAGSPVQQRATNSAPSTSRPRAPSPAGANATAPAPTTISTSTPANAP